MKTVISNCTYIKKPLIKKELNKYKNYSREELLKIKPKLIRSSYE